MTFDPSKLEDSDRQLYEQLLAEQETDPWDAPKWIEAAYSALVMWSRDPDYVNVPALHRETMVDVLLKCAPPEIRVAGLLATLQMQMER